MVPIRQLNLLLCNLKSLFKLLILLLQFPRVLGGNGYAVLAGEPKRLSKIGVHCLNSAVLYTGVIGFNGYAHVLKLATRAYVVLRQYYGLYLVKAYRSLRLGLKILRRHSGNVVCKEHKGIHNVIVRFVYLWPLVQIIINAGTSLSLGDGFAQYVCSIPPAIIPCKGDCNIGKPIHISFPHRLIFFKWDILQSTAISLYIGNSAIILS